MALFDSLSALFFKIVKKRAIIALCCLWGHAIFGQTLELGLILGGSNYQGDLASSEFSVFTKQVNLAAGGFLRYNFNEILSAKLQILKTDLEADDAHSSLEILRQRNLRFFSPLLDASLRLEWHFLEHFSNYKTVISPYLSLGGSFFTFNPQAEYQGRTYELQALSTEGQGLAVFPDRKPYNLYNFTGLLGGGIRFYIHEDFSLAIDFSIHQAFTDYLDDVSTTYPDYRELFLEKGSIAADISYQVDDFFGLEQTGPLPNTVRGNADLNDFYLLGGITISYYLINPERAGGKGIGCPTF